MNQRAMRIPMRSHTVHRNVGRSDRVVSAVLGTWSLLHFRRSETFLGKMATLASGGLLLARAVRGHSRAYEALGVSSAGLEEGAGIDIQSSITVRRPLEELYAYWRNLENLPLVMRHLESVEDLGGGMSHWVARGPRNMKLEWDAQLFNERVNEYLAWQSMPGSRIDHAGSVHFHSAGDQGTEVLVRMRYNPPGGAYGFGLAKLLNPISEADMAEDLRRFKHTMETGIDITTKGQPSGPPKGGATT